MVIVTRRAEDRLGVVDQLREPGESGMGGWVGGRRCHERGDARRAARVGRVASFQQFVCFDVVALGEKKNFVNRMSWRSLIDGKK